MSVSKLRRPLFIIGSPRSGTSVLRLILTCHSQILIPPECGFIIWLHSRYADWRLADNDSPSRVQAFLDDLFLSKKYGTWMLDRGIIEEQIAFYKPENYAELCAVIYIAFGLKSGKRCTIWGDKNNFHVDHLQELVDLYKEARILHIVRDGRDVACSYREVMAAKSKSPYAPNLETNVAKIALEWSTNVVKIDSFMSVMQKESAMTIRYEDLVSQSISSLRDICEWLNLSYEAGMLDFYLSNTENKIEPELTMDWKRRTLQPISDETVGRYASLLNKREQEEFSTVAARALRRFSYV